MEQDLRVAVADDRFLLHYQPRLSLDDGEVRAAEALIRWPHRKHGLVPPGAFIPIAERSNLITAIGGWVLRAACAEAADWAAPGASGPTVSVNVSPRQLHDSALLGQVATALDDSGLPPERLELEITESMLVEGSIETLLTLSAIRDLGVSIALDDFGTGYASLSMLKRLPLTAMKLDRSLVRELPANREDAVIVRALVETGHALGLTVVAEGVETESQRAFLAGIGCDEGQGFLFSHPVASETLRARLRLGPRPPDPPDC